MAAVDSFIQTCSSTINCELHDFMDALEVWEIKPHVVNRRLAGSITLFKRLYHEVLDSSTIEKILVEALSALNDSQKGLNKCCISSEETKEASHNIELKPIHDEAPKTVLHNDEAPETYYPETFFQPVSIILSHILKEHSLLDSAIVDVGVVLRKYLPRNIERYSPTYEVIVTVSEISDVTAIFIPISTETDVTTSLFHRTHFIHYSSRNLSISHYVYHDFDKAAPSSALVPTKDWLIENLVKKLKTWSEASFQSKTPLRKSQSLSLVDIEQYSKLYMHLKKKYGEHLVKTWTENTDPLKYVYEDIAIATYLLLLWSDERKKTNTTERQSFVDLGCGNGLLVYLLSSEGHRGRGIDITPRKIWKSYGESTILQESVINPEDMTVHEDWIIGNHSDELTPWIPLIASRSSCETKYFVLPCCFHDFYGKFHRNKQSKPQYETYLEYVKLIGEKCGYHVEQDVMRIPSTKRVCQIGRKRLKSIDCRTMLREIIQETSSTANSIDKSEFKAREVTNDPKNCSHVDKQIKDKILDSITHKLLLESNDDLVSCSHDESRFTSTGVPWSHWKAGGAIHLNQLVRMFDSSVLKELKSQCGGLQTLLKNHRHIFKVIGGMVSLRDYRKHEDTLPSYRTQMKMKSGESDHSERLKTKLCWFHANHPQGCVSNEQCKFAHGERELRVEVSRNMTTKTCQET